MSLTEEITGVKSVSFQNGDKLEVKVDLDTNGGVKGFPRQLDSNVNRGSGERSNECLTAIKTAVEEGRVSPLSTYCSTLV